MGVLFIIYFIIYYLLFYLFIIAFLFFLEKGIILRNLEKFASLQTPKWKHRDFEIWDVFKVAYLMYTIYV